MSVDFQSPLSGANNSMTAIPLSLTPDDVVIQARDLKFDVAKHLGANWCGNDAFRTDFFNALSLSFPRGEKLFVDSVQHFVARINDEKLKHVAAEFVKQEYLHRREHERYNVALCEARGFEKDHIESIYAKRIVQSNALPPLVKLSITVCFEHFTALFADGVLTDPRWLENVDAEIAKLWQWHSVEETEHKSVAFDVYMAVGGTRKMLHKTMRYVSYRFFMNTFKTMRLMQKSDNRPMAIFSYWVKGLRYLFGRNGIFRVQKDSYKRFFADDFHPWEFDNRSLISSTLAKLDIGSAN